MQRNLSENVYLKLLCGEKVLELVPNGIRAISHHAVSFTKFTEIESIKVTPTHVFITDLKATMHSTTNNQPVLGVSRH